MNRFSYHCMAKSLKIFVYISGVEVSVTSPDLKRGYGRDYVYTPTLETNARADISLICINRRAPHKRNFAVYPSLKKLYVGIVWGLTRLSWPSSPWSRDREKASAL